MRAAPPLRVHFNPARPTFISEGVSHDSIVRGGILHPTGDQKILIPKQIGHSRFVYLESEPARTVAPSRTGGETAEISTQPLIPVIADNCGKNRDWRKQYNIHILQRNCQKPKNPPPIQIVACGQLRTAGMWRSHTPPSPAWSSPRAPVYFQSAHAPPLTIPSSPDSPTTPSLLNYGEIPPAGPGTITARSASSGVDHHPETGGIAIDRRGRRRNHGRHPTILRRHEDAHGAGHVHLPQWNRRMTEKRRSITVQKSGLMDS